MDTLRDGVIETAEGRWHRHGSVPAVCARLCRHHSRKSQSNTADHVVVAVERLNGKAAYVACSRGRYTCTVHTPAKAALLAELPEGSRLAALEFLGSGSAHTHRRKTGNVNALGRPPATGLSVSG